VPGVLPFNIPHFSHKKAFFFFQISFLDEFNPIVPSITSITSLDVANVRVESITIIRLRLTLEKEKRKQKRFHIL
jgi:hypothetical protein